MFSLLMLLASWGRQGFECDRVAVVGGAAVCWVEGGEAVVLGEPTISVLTDGDDVYFYVEGVLR